MPATDCNPTNLQAAPRPLRFLHVPKTAGTSLNIFLDRFYPPESIFVFNASMPLAENLARLRNLPPERRHTIKLYRGHAPLTVGDPRVDEARTFTFLRDPVQRVVSFCHHLAEGKKKSHMLSSPAEVPAAEDFDLQAFLTSGEPELENLQTRMLVGEGVYRSLKSSGDPQALNQALSAAFARIEFVGVQESFEEGLLLASLFYSWWPPFSFTKKSNTRSLEARLNFSASQLELVRSLNLMDVEAHLMASAIYRRYRQRSVARLLALKVRIRWHRMLAALPTRRGVST